MKPRAAGSASLDRYAAKRDFRATSEPAPSAATAPSALPRFVIQKHAASRLHFDFRLEMGGVLKSWALTRGPSSRAGERRLAVRTEDHPIAYADYEGTIPKGQYGGGTVMLWDEGSYRLDDPDWEKGLAEGKLHFTLMGRRLSGEWALVRPKPRPGERQEQWLFLKIGGADDKAFDAVAHYVTSVRTGRTMKAIEAGEAPPPAVRADLPAFRPFQLCTPADTPPEGDDWLHELKHDGYRAQLAVAGDRLAIRLRSGQDATDRMPGLAVALGTLGPHRLLIDGELVVQDSEGRSRFGLLQAALADGDDTPIRFMAFDLLAEGDSNLEQLPLAERKARLKAAIEGRSDRLLYSDHIEGEGDSLFSEACRLGLEGIVSKRADAPYRGRRTADWLKVKCAVSADFRIVGWLPSDARMGFRSLLLASGESKALRYAGKVGTGFTGPEMEALLDRLGPLETKEPPVSAPRTAVRGARWVRPELEAEVGYAEITAEGVLRHARFLRLRDPADRDPPPARKPPVRNKESPMARAAKAPPGLPAISSRDRIVFPEAGLSKGDLADWYVRAAPHILAQAGHRPLSLVRCPDGIAGKCFFQKHSGDGFTGVRETRADAEGKRWLYVDDAAGLLGCVQMGAIEFHGWGSRVGALDRPDRLVFDLDPDEGLPFIRTADAALELRDLLAEMGLASFPMLSGGKGVHVVIPLDGSARWPAVKDFAHRFATALETRAPGRYTARAAKAGRTGRIFIDWMRNLKGATSVMPWTVRARPAASVAVPLSWGDLGTAGSAAAYTLADPDRIIAHAERLTGWGQPGQPLPDF